MIPSYPKIHHLGNAGTDKVYQGRAIVQEKTDGSQFRWGIDANGDFSAHTRRTTLEGGTTDKNFAPSLNHLMQPHIQDTLRAWYRVTGPVFFYGEAVARPHHNTLAYDDVPRGHIVLFDAIIGGKWVTDMNQLAKIADALEVEMVPVLHDTDRDGSLTLELIKTYSNSRSFLDAWARGKKPGIPEGGVTVEGVVVKNYEQQLPYNGLSQPCFVKLVRPEFKERNNENWKEQRQGGILGYLEGFQSEGLWRKVVQHARDDGELNGTVQDIGALMKRLSAEVEEDRETYAQELYNLFRRDIQRAAGKGFAEWYKGILTDGN